MNKRRIVIFFLILFFCGLYIFWQEHPMIAPTVLNFIILAGIYYHHRKNYDCEKKCKKSPPLTEKEKIEAKRAANHSCENSNCENREYLEVHHILPRSKCGTNKIINLIVLCPLCHKKAHGGVWSRGILREWIAQSRLTS